MRLRTFCTSNYIELRRDLDEYGSLLFLCGVEAVKLDRRTRIQRKAEVLDTEAKKLDIQDLASMRWGPTQVPLFNLLGLFSLLRPERRESSIMIARYLISEGVPVDRQDLSGRPLFPIVSPLNQLLISSMPRFSTMQEEMLALDGGQGL